MSSAVATALAVQAAGRNGVARTIVPSSARSVVAASAASIVHASWSPLSGSFGKRKSRWSKTHRLSMPPASARRASSRMRDQLGVPAPSSSAMGSTSPTFIRGW